MWLSCQHIVALQIQRVIHGLPYEFWEINESTVVDIICWVFLVFPIFFFTLYIYEPRWLRVLRLKQWAKFRGRAEDADMVFEWLPSRHFLKFQIL